MYAAGLASHGSSRSWVCCTWQWVLGVAASVAAPGLSSWEQDHIVVACWYSAAGPAPGCGGGSGAPSGAQTACLAIRFVFFSKSHEHVQTSLVAQLVKKPPSKQETLV